MKIVHKLQDIGIVTIEKVFKIEQLGNTSYFEDENGKIIWFNEFLAHTQEEEYDLYLRLGYDDSITILSGERGEEYNGQCKNL